MLLICVGANLVLMLLWAASDGHFLLESFEKGEEKCAKTNEARTIKLTGFLADKH